MKYLMILLFVLFTGCSTKGAADLKEKDNFIGNVKRIMRVTSPGGLFLTVTLKEIQKDLQNNFDKSGGKEIGNCTKSTVRYDMETNQFWCIDPVSK